VHGILEPSGIQAGFMVENGFYIGIGMADGPVRTVVKWSIDASLKSTHTVLGDLPGYYGINAGAATWDAASRTVFTQLMLRNATKEMDLVEVKLDSSDDKAQISHVLSNFCTIGSCPFEMKYLN
jgi:hypothetical protein